MSQGRIALVTGAGRGIGRTIADRLLADGMSVIIADLSADLARSTAAELGSAAHWAEVNIASRDSVEAAVKSVLDGHGRIDVLVNNAGIVSSTPWEETSMEEWNQVLSVNLTGTMLMTQTVLPGMIERTHGRIINIVSLAGRNGGVSVGPAYAASKAGIIGLTRHFAGKVARVGVTVNAVAPGTTRTPMVDAFSDEQMAAINAAIPVGRLGEPAEIAAAVSYFASTDAAFTTGAVLDVNGGMYFG